MSSSVGVNAAGTSELILSLTRGRRSRRCGARGRGLADCSVLLAIEIIDDPSDVRACLVIRRYAVILLDSQWAGVVGSQCFGNIVVIERKKIQKISCAGLYIGLRIEAVLHAEL